jgi:hypothetical protein
VSRGNPYTESGFQITASTLMASYCVASPNFGGAAIFVNAFGGTGSLSAVDNSTFGISSIDLANLFAAPATAGPMSFTGHLLGGGTVTQTFNFALGLTSPPVFSTFAFSAAFVNLISLDLPPEQSLQGVGQLYQFTNVRLNATSVAPEPASFVLMGTGLVGLGIAARYRKRRSAVPRG